jgi:predicted permease
MQASFRGNLAYIGVPVLSYGTHANKETLASGVIIMVGLMASYNILAVLVLQSGKHQQPDWKKMGRSILGNPLLLSGTLGLVFSALSLSLPGFLIKTLDSLGGAAVPIALLCIGGSLAVTSLQGRLSWILAAALLKVAVLPGIVWILVSIAGLGPAEQRIALVLASAPTAAASYIMAREMGGDEALASGSIALSTILSGLSLAFALWITS